MPGHIPVGSGGGCGGVVPLCLLMDFTQTFLGNHGTIKEVESKVIFYQIREFQVAGNATTTKWLELATRYVSRVVK